MVNIPLDLLKSLDKAPGETFAVVEAMFLNHIAVNICKFVTVSAMKAYEGVEIQLHLFLYAILDGVNGQLILLAA
jgi:hypothetical protein